MRTTLTLDDDVAAKLRALTRRSGQPFRQVVNETLRRGLARPPVSAAHGPFTATVRDLGRRRSGLTLDNIGDLLEQIEGPSHR
jgi:hypothetical protein